MVATSLLDLPPELILEISDFLSPDNILALKLTHRTLDRTLPALPRLKNRTVTVCTRLAIERWTTPTNPPPSHIRCILCKNVYPANLFISSSSPACMPMSFARDEPRPEVVELPERFCCWHIGRLARVIPTEVGGRNEWVSCIRRMCMHCGAIEGWERCDCACDSCGLREVRTYTRFLSNRTECRRFIFWRNPAAGESEDRTEKAKGRLYVREYYWDPDVKSNTAMIDLPVRYLDKLARSDSNRPQRRSTGSFSFDKYTTAGRFLCSMPS